MKKLLGAAALTALVLTMGTAEAQTYTLTVAGPATVDVNSDFDASATLDFDGPNNMAGWSFGVCNDTANITLNSSEQGSTTATVNNGNPPGFAQGNDFPEGYTVGVVVDLLGAASLAPGTGYELQVGHYTAGANATLASTIQFCNTLGSPPVDTVVVINGASITPNQVGLDVEVAEPPPATFNYIAPNLSANFDAASGTGSLTAQFSIQEDAAGTGFPNNTQGFSMGVSHDASILEIVGTPTSLLTPEPEFNQTQALADGWTAGVVYSLLGGVFQVFDAALPVFEVEYAISGLAGAAETTTTLAFSNNLGTPPVANVVVVSGLSLDASFVDGTVTLLPVTDTPFLRGDCNSDLRLDIADGVWILNNLFLGGPAGTCAEACDADSNDALSMTDAMWVFNYRLLSGPAPAAPFPNCGTEAGADCDASACP
jgi:hypothetical protein